MSNLTVRIISGLTAAPLSLFLVYWSNSTRWGMMLVVIAIAAWEWARMVAKKVEGPRMVVVSPVLATLFTLAWIFQPHWHASVLLASIIMVTVLLTVAFARVNIENMFVWIALHASGPLYLGLWGGMLLRLMGEGRGLRSSSAFIVVMSGMWFCDSFAYIFGRLLGKHKLAPQISPKKTWEGALGGTLATIIFVIVLGPWAFHTSLLINILLGALISVAGQAGDLLESALKRWAGSKDSSQAFPGHGGILDRFDSMLLAGPLVVVILAIVRGY